MKNEIDFDDIYADVIEFNDEITKEEIVSAYDKLAELKEQFEIAGDIEVLGDFGFGVDVDKKKAMEIYDELDWDLMDETDFDDGIVASACEFEDAGEFGQIMLDNTTSQSGYKKFAKLAVTFNEL